MFDTLLGAIKTYVSCSEGLLYYYNHRRKYRKMFSRDFVVYFSLLYDLFDHY